jgi:hypothetical protein
MVGSLDLTLVLAVVCGLLGLRRGILGVYYGAGIDALDQRAGSMCVGRGRGRGHGSWYVWAA